MSHAVTATRERKRVLTKRGPLEEEKWQPTSLFLCREPQGKYTKTKRYDTRRRASRLDVQYVTGEEQRAITNSSRKNKVAGPKWKWHSVVDVSGGDNKVYKEQYFIGTWNIKSMNQGKRDTVKQEMARLNTDILGISELKWTGMGEFNSDDHYINYYGQEFLRRNEETLIVKKSPNCSTWVQPQKWQNDPASSPRQAIQHQ